MRKYFIIASFVLLAAACGKSQPVITSQSQTSNQQTATSSSTTVATTTSGSAPAKATPPLKPLTVSVYTSPSKPFTINYTSDFKIFVGAAYQHSGSGLNASACDAGFGTPVVCAVLNDPQLTPTNFESAAVSVVTLFNKSLSQCASFTSAEVGNGHATATVTINGIVFITAISTDAAASNYSETHMSRTFYGSTCYQINEMVRWANAQVFSPPRQEFDQAAVFQRLDFVRGGFRLTASQPASAIPSINLK